MDYKKKIKEFLEKETQKTIADESADLIGSGVLDSFSMMKLISYIQTDLGVAVDMEKLTPENFNSIEKIAAFIK